MNDQNHVIEATLLDGRVRCLQPESGYRVAIDTVLLAAATPAKPGERVLDVGTGAGAAGLCIMARMPGVRIDGLEVQPTFAELARQNAELNGISDQFKVIEGDISLSPNGIQPDTYDHVMTNPPFVEAGRGRVPPEQAKAIATMESHVPLSDWIAYCIRMARTKGTVTIIHRADRIEEILTALVGKVGEVVIFPLWPGGDTPDQPAKRVIVQGRKGMKGSTVLSTGLVLHKPGGDYTENTKNVLVNAQTLEIR